MDLESPLPAATMAAVIPGAGPEQGEYSSARRAFTVALLGRPVANSHLAGRAVRVTSWDVRSPQVFVDHPRVIDALESSSLGIEVAYPHLPGRVPPAGWDGEPGAMAPGDTGV